MPSGFHGRTFPYPTDATVLQLFERTAERVPDRPAVTFGDVSLTYRALNERSNGLAEILQQRGVTRGDLIPLVMGNCLELPVAMIALMKLSAPFVPLDEASPRDRLTTMIGRIEPKVVLRTDNVPPLVADDRDLPMDQRSLPERGSDDFGRPAELDDLVYGFYTSGSTGEPKCALNLHRGLLNRFLYMTRRFGAGPDVVLQNSRHVFDSSLWQLLWPLTNGNQAVIPDRRGLLDLDATIAIIKRHAITMTDFVPSIFNALVELLRAQPSLADDLGSLRQLLIGGEEIDPRAVRTFRSILPKTGITNTYGPTEAAIGSIFHEVTDADDESIPLGDPIDNTFAVIVGDSLKPAAPGTIGEILIGGDCLGTGYLDDREKTEAAFVANPFAEIPGPRLYRTGDLGYCRPDGLIAFAGRRDRQVKIGGIRVELPEIEQALVAHSRVREAKVLARTAASRKVLAAFVTVRAPLTVRELRAHALASLPASLVPGQLFVLDNFPLTDNGKVNHRELERLASGGPKPGAPAGLLTPAETAVRGIWQDLLAVEAIAGSDDFFDLGGDSLSALRLALALEERFGLRVKVSDIVEAPTLAAQATFVTGEAITATVSRDFLIRDTELPSDVVVHRPGPAGAVDCVLLTGATGFVGAHLLHELLARTKATVYCLVRAADEEAARARLAANLRRYRVWSGAEAERIVPVPGDLGVPRLGLSEERYQRLAECVDTVLHNGSMVNLVLPYQSHRAANVVGTREILRFATTARTKNVHYVSTLAVCESAAARPVSEQPASGFEPPAGGYGQSKWVAERLLEAAAARGLPVAVYRLGEVMPHSLHGVPSTRGLADGLVRACLRTGMVFRSPIEMDYTPVDQISEFIVAAVRLTETGHFHVLQPSAVRFDELLDRFRAGHALREADYSTFWSAVEGLCSTSPDDADLVRLLAAIPPPAEADNDRLARLFADGTAIFATQRATAFAARAGIRRLSLDRSVLDRYASYQTNEESNASLVR